ncbi:hypothetical protein GCM10022199_06390 [Marihabitans asiaticum]|uniref:Uncharacterized protein DUF4878 n=1 Tax=Marihabitans asiaticum TaxID=415218 RepID=A0A560WDV1_9MICO|nr:DUF4878 domain-containing protein [Marihabitans asiaticum]TWD15704.1 uncharacterized protein DUF4878 [Marihabitans asiaticum]
MIRRWQTLALACLVGLAGCASGDTPEATVEDFAQAASAGDFERVCELLDPEQLKAFELSAPDESCPQTLAEVAQESPGGALIGDPDQLEIGEATVSEDGVTATVPTTYDGRSSEIKLVRIDDRWRVNLGP